MNKIMQMFDCIYNYFNPQEAEIYEEDLNMMTMSEEFTTLRIQDHLMTQSNFKIAPSLLKQRTNYTYQEQEDYDFSDHPEATTPVTKNLKLDSASINSVQVTPASPVK